MNGVQRCHSNEVDGVESCHSYKVDGLKGAIRKNGRYQKFRFEIVQKNGRIEFTSDISLAIFGDSCFET